MTYEVTGRQKLTTTGCAFFSFSGTPSAGNPLTPAITGSSTNFTPTIVGNNIRLPAGEYFMRFYGAITRTNNASNLTYQWRENGGALVGVIGATNREIAPGAQNNSFDSADAHISISATTDYNIEMVSVDSNLTLDTTNTHAVIWSVI